MVIYVDNTKIVTQEKKVIGEVSNISGYKVNTKNQFYNYINIKLKLKKSLQEHQKYKTCRES